MTNAAKPTETTAEPLAETAPEVALAFEPIDEHTVLIRLGTALDYRNAERFKAASQAMVQAGARRFILDASHVGVLDSTGLGALFSLYRLVGPKDGMVALAAPSYPVQALVNMMKLYRVFPQYRSVEQAHEMLRRMAFGGGPEDALDSLEDALEFSLEADPDSLDGGPWDFFDEASWSGSPPPKL